MSSRYLPTNFMKRIYMKQNNMQAPIQVDMSGLVYNIYNDKVGIYEWDDLKPFTKHTLLFICYFSFMSHGDKLASEN